MFFKIFTCYVNALAGKKNDAREREQRGSKVIEVKEAGTPLQVVHV